MCSTNRILKSSLAPRVLPPKMYHRASKDFKIRLVLIRDLVTKSMSRLLIAKLISGRAQSGGRYMQR